MTNAFSEISGSTLQILSQSIGQNLGLHFPEGKWPDLRRALEKAAPSLGFDSIQSCANWFIGTNDPSRIERLIQFLTVGETHFFRDTKLFQALEEKFLPEIVNLRRLDSRSLKIWSAGCATGEEPYSLAIVLSRMLPDLFGWNVTILATDINREFLSKAEKGVYSDWSFRSVPQDIRRDFFESKGDHSVLNPDIKKMVTFTEHNLAKDPYPSTLPYVGSMDLIFCRNVIMYFSMERQEQIISKLADCLVDGGLLVVSPAEASSVTRSDLIPVNYPGIVLFRKSTSESRAKPLNPLLFSSLVETPEPVQNSDDNPFVWNFVPPTLTIPDFVQPEAFVPYPEETPEAAEQELSPYVEGLNLYDQGRYAEAIEVLLGYVSFNGNQHSGTALSLLSRAYANLGKLDEALDWAQKSVNADKLNAEYHYLEATILQEMGRNQETATCLQKAVFLNPDLAAAHFALANVSLRMNNRKLSDRHFRIALSVLGNYDHEDAVPSTEGMSAGKLIEIITSMLRKEKSA
ncbi:CheR family methyltransferase [Desulfomonile tiedjei]|uniref:Methylase of chemotaxis methyl-accepting protein n=1 Tax=Desulfomonile tiedjei (strain ATCC 49306 / DSM 6799 / DCB-1) TaxID=706587 RepID=I4BZP7_DESTA|nr:CheR family methyltransferase [Desulfomonile tiedjei]AFM22788.1 methylase of chemotaxis methyl-accepting protein [Desulfomonile tiedjei DSM 6799]